MVEASAEAEGSSEAVADAISVALSVAEADAVGDGVGEGADEGAAALVSVVGDASWEAKGRLPQAARDRAVMGRRVAAIRRAGESFEWLMARE